MAFPLAPADGQQYTNTAGTTFRYEAATDRWVKISVQPTNLRIGKNAIINGSMNVWQRGTVWTPVSGGYTADRWYCTRNGTMAHQLSRNLAQHSDFYYSLYLDCTTAETPLGAGDYVIMYQAIEGYNFAPLVGKQCILSFWVYSTKTGIFSVMLANSNNSRSYTAEYTVNASNVWEK
jgi:hypothetical protein